MTARVAVIGPGRVGTAVAVLLAGAGYDVVAVAGGSTASREAFCARVGSARDAGSGDAAVTDAIGGADLVVLAVPDDAVESVARRAARDDAVTDQQRWIHLAGSRGAAALRAAALAGAAVAACHPAQSVPDADTGVAALDGAAWAVTASPANLPWATALVTDLGGRPVPVAEVDRVRYHAALALASNATSAVVTLARDLLLSTGVADPERLLEPLATASVRGAASRGAAALTGPVRRGDAGTIAAHRTELEVSMPEALPAWEALAELQLALSRRAGLEPSAVAAVADAIRGDRA